MLNKHLSSKYLNALYRKYNRRCYIDSDPLALVHRVGGDLNREVAGLVASSLSYGRVQHIQRSVEEAFRRLGPLGAAAERVTRQELTGRMGGFRHRFTTGDELAGLLFGAGCLIREHGSLGAAFASMLSPGDDTVLAALTRFAEALTSAAQDGCPSLIPRPSRGSACKRLNLYVRWMVRHDDVDLGLWKEVPASALIVPLDTHMHRIGLDFGLTERKAPDMKTALEITRGFAAFSPMDPVKFDFALTRPGILGADNREITRERFRHRRSTDEAGIVERQRAESRAQEGFFGVRRERRR